MKIHKILRENKVRVISDTGKMYDVDLNYPLTCTCPHFNYRLVDIGGLCKHIKFVTDRLGGIDDELFKKPKKME